MMNITLFKKPQLFFLPLLLIMIFNSPLLQAEEVTPVFPIDQSVKLDPKLKLPKLQFFFASQCHRVGQNTPIS